ncbi:MAG: glycosyltransferase family 2 protein [Candidatus Buchananbacteria bacterium]|nr:glycosyltransferase family 2 protein [Candidatus Buchananbacteria bacterium]
MNNPPKISVILPCQNEEEALAGCIKEIQKVFVQENIDGEIIVSDSSSDQSPEIAVSLGAKLIRHGQDGYGNACLEGLRAAEGDIIIIADADGSYDFNFIPDFIKSFTDSCDLVIGNRFAGKMGKKVMPFFNHYLGNPFLSLVLRLFFRAKVKDAHCGMRAISREAFNKLDLKTGGMEFASEMIIKAVKKKMKIGEIPINYRSRQGRSKLRPLNDGWRHLRLMLLYSPTILFLIPGAILFLLGIIMTWLLYFGALSIWGLKFYYHPMFASSLLIIIGYQLIFFSLFAKKYAQTHLGERSLFLEKFSRFFNLEKLVLAGVAMFLAGLIIYVIILTKWIGSGFGNLAEIKNSIVALVLIVLGIQTITSSFMIGILDIRNTRH